jgi:hypothetical protein
MIPNIPIQPLFHYCNDSANAEWLREQIAMESEGERTYQGERLVNVAGVALVPESMAAELLSGVAS